MTPRVLLSHAFLILTVACLPPAEEDAKEEEIAQVGVRLTPPSSSECDGVADCPVGSSCATRPDGQSQCMTHCDRPGEYCDDGTLCLETSQQGAPSICFAPARDSAPGTPCTGPFACRQGLHCAKRPGRQVGECMAACQDPGSLCEGGEACLDSSAGPLCYLGGEGGVGAACKDSKGCGAGLRCAGKGGEERECLWACEEDTQCDSGFYCLRAAGEGGGVCLHR